MTVLSVKPARLHLYDITLDDGQCGSIDKTVWEHSGFAVGSALDDAQWEALLEHSAQHRAREKALYYLSLRDYGSGELETKLCRVGIDRDLAHRTVSRLTESGLIDDTRYATMLARDMSERKLYPKRRIAMALREKGFPSAAVEDALLQIDDKEEQQALELLKKKRYNGFHEPAEKQKALAMLARYGFSFSAAKRAIERYADEDDE